MPTKLNQTYKETYSETSSCECERQQHFSIKRNGIKSKYLTNIMQKYFEKYILVNRFENFIEVNPVDPILSVIFLPMIRLVLVGSYLWWK